MYHLAKLRPYSCPKCGSFLEVDREQDNFDCPFCGSRFDAVSFHGKDLLEQAAECIHSKEFRKALEKYDYLLSKRPEKFEYLYGYACAVGGMSSLDDYDDPKKYNVKLAALLSNDPRFRTGPAGPYFRKLSEMHSLARRRSKLLTEQKSMETKALAESESIYEERRYNGEAFRIFLYIHLFVGLILLVALVRKLGILIILYYLLTPLIVYWVTNSKHKAKQEKLDPYYEGLLAPLNEQKHIASEMLKEIRELRIAYDEAYSELADLKPETVSIAVPEAKKAVPKKNGGSVNNGKTVLCKKCGAGLVLDKEKKLYICNHCGVSYDYSVFVGSPKTKAYTYHKNGEFELADKLFMQILSEDPADFYANRGRILCAGRWIGFIQIKLNESLMNVNWESLNRVLDAAIKNSYGPDLEYFNELKKLIGIVEEYVDVNAKLVSDEYADEYSRLFERRQELIDIYPGIYKDFIEVDNRHRTSKINDFSDRADSKFAYRMRIFELGHWNSINDIEPTKPFGVGGLQAVLSVIEDAKNNTEDEYADYFIMWEQFMNMLGDYAVFRSEHRELGGEGSYVNTMPLDDTDLLASWEEVRRQRFAIEEKDKELRKEIKDFQNKLIEMDNKLY